MATTEVLNLLSKFYNYGTNNLGLFPLYFRKSTGTNSFTVRIRNISEPTKYCWSAILCISLAVSCLELYLSLTVNKTKNILKILYHGFLLLSKIGAYSCIYVFHNKIFELMQLWKYLCSKQLARVQVHANKNFPFKKSKQFYLLIIMCIFSMFIFYLIFLPIVVVTLPCLHDALRINYLFPSCNESWFRLFLLLTQLIFLVPITATGPIVSATGLVTLKEISIALNSLWYATFKKFSSNRLKYIFKCF